jgi:hypothetical protein
MVKHVKDRTVFLLPFVHSFEKKICLLKKNNLFLFLKKNEFIVRSTSYSQGIITRS